MRKIALALAFLPLMANAGPTQCTFNVTDMRLASGPSQLGGPDYLGHLAVRGDVFGGGNVPLCILDRATETGKPILGGFPVRVDANQCERWVTAVELALALDMRVSLSYEPSVQPDCANLVEGAYPFSLEVHGS